MPSESLPVRARNRMCGASASPRPTALARPALQATRLLPLKATPAQQDDLPSFHARLARAVAAARAVAEWRGRRPALPSYGTAPSNLPHAEVAGDARLLEAWHEGAWAALAAAHASAMSSGDWDAVLGSGGGGS